MKPVQSTRPSCVADETLATYSWVPSSYRGAVFLAHGFRAHAQYNFLRSDTPTSLRNYGNSPTSSSLVRELNNRHLAVFAHDHLGHGNSTGLRAYFPTFASLVSDLLSYVSAVDEELQLRNRDIPIFLLGHSMGGTVCILTARDNPDLFAGMVLCSAASEPPASMFGLKGRIQYALSGITSRLVPKMELLALPKAPDEDMEKLFEADPLNCQEMLRARVGREFIDAYTDINNNVAKVETPFLTVSGEHDTLVNPEAAKRFYEGARSEDKTIRKMQGRWHNLLVENGREEMWTIFADWIAERAAKTPATPVNA